MSSIVENRARNILGLLLSISSFFLFITQCTRNAGGGVQSGVLPGNISSSDVYLDIAPRSDGADLKVRLERYAQNNTIFLTICNRGMAIEWLQQWYVSARRVGIENLIVVATDTEAYDWIYARIGDRVIHVQDITPLLSSTRWQRGKKGENKANQAYDWRSKGYENIVVQRATILGKIMMHTNVDIVYSDTDIHWFKNPLDLLLTKYNRYHLCLQREQGVEIGDYNCSGFMYLRNRKLTILFMKAWEFYIEERLKKKGFFTDQEEINRLLRDTVRNYLPQEYFLLAKYLRAATFEWDEFPSGVNYFKKRVRGKGRFTENCRSKICKKLMWKDVSKGNISKMKKEKTPYLVHHNYAKSNQLKITRAKEFGLWIELNPIDWWE